MAPISFASRRWLPAVMSTSPRRSNRVRWKESFARWSIDCRFGVIGGTMLIISPMLRLILFTLLLLLTDQAAPAQCTKKISDLPAAPELLGFHLGMTKDQIKARVPQTVFGRADDFGVTKTTINPYFDPTIDKTKFEGVRSVS